MIEQIDKSLNFALGRYYLVNGMKARITHKIATQLQGFVIIPDNIWVPTFWWKDGSSLNKKFNLGRCVENHEEQCIKWDTE